MSHGEGSQKVDDKNHRLENLEMGLQHFVLELSPEARSYSIREADSCRHGPQEIEGIVVLAHETDRDAHHHGNSLYRFNGFGWLVRPPLFCFGDVVS